MLVPNLIDTNQTQNFIFLNENEKNSMLMFNSDNFYDVLNKDNPEIKKIISLDLDLIKLQKNINGTQVICQETLEGLLSKEITLKLKDINSRDSNKNIQNQELHDNSESHEELSTYENDFSRIYFKIYFNQQKKEDQVKSVNKKHGIGIGYEKNYRLNDYFLNIHSKQVN